MTNTYFQGDIVITTLPKDQKIPEGLTKLKPEAKGLVLAYGETSGHAHAFRETTKADIYYNNINSNKSDNGILEMYIYVKDPQGIYLYHEEHDKIFLPMGFYVKFNQKEYTFEEEYRVVAD
jgi:hypothetical protein